MNHNSAKKDVSTEKSLSGLKSRMYSYMNGQCSKVDHLFITIYEGKTIWEGVNRNIFHWSEKDIFKDPKC